MITHIRTQKPLFRSIAVFLALFTLFSAFSFGQAKAETDTAHKLLLNLSYEKGPLLDRPKVEVFVDGYYVGIIKSGKSQTFYLESVREMHTIYLIIHDGIIHDSNTGYIWQDFFHKDDMTVDITFKNKDNKLSFVHYETRNECNYDVSNTSFTNIDNSYYFTYYEYSSLFTKRGRVQDVTYYDFANGIVVYVHYSKAKGKETSWASPHWLSIRIVGDERRIYVSDKEDTSYYLFDEDGNLHYYKHDGALSDETLDALGMGRVRYPVLDLLKKYGFYEEYPTPADVPRN